jgi:hypothetical protein
MPLRLRNASKISMTGTFAKGRSLAVVCQTIRFRRFTWPSLLRSSVFRSFTWPALSPGAPCTSAPGTPPSPRRAAPESSSRGQSGGTGRRTACRLFGCQLLTLLKHANVTQPAPVDIWGLRGAKVEKGVRAIDRIKHRLAHHLIFNLVARVRPLLAAMLGELAAIVAARELPLEQRGHRRDGEDGERKERDASSIDTLSPSVGGTKCGTRVVRAIFPSPRGRKRPLATVSTPVSTPVLTPVSRQVLTRTNTYFCCVNTVPYSNFAVSTLKPEPCPDL